MARRAARCYFECAAPVAFVSEHGQGFCAACWQALETRRIEGWARVRAHLADLRALKTALQEVMA